MSVFRLWNYMRPRLAAIAVGLLFSVIAGMASAAVAGLLKPMFNEVFFLDPAASTATSAPAAGPLPSADLPGGDAMDRLHAAVEGAIVGFARKHLGYRPSRAFIFVPICFVLAFMIRGAFTYLSNFRLGMVTLRAIQSLRLDLYERIQRQSLTFFNTHHTGLLISRVTSDVALIQNFLGSPAAEFVRLLFSLLFLFAAALLLDWRLALVCVAVLPVTIYPATRFAYKIKRSTSASQSRLADLANRLHETVAGRRVVRVFNTERFEIGRFRDVLGGMLRADRRALKYLSLTQPVIEMIGAAAMGALAGFAGWRIHTGRLNPGEFLATLAALYWMYAILKRCARIGNDFTRATAAAERVFEVLDLDRDVVEAPFAEEMKPFSREIRFRGAHFSYGSEPVLQGIDLTIHKGEKVAIVGASGAGKTTLVNLVPRFYDVTAGTLEIDGVDVRSVTLASLRRQIGLVTQDVVLFDDTVHNNIAYGCPDVPLERVIAAASAAHAHEFIERLPDGYAARLGEGGQSLSVGQRQRISIARALLKDAPILILDEATSALDAQSEALVQEALATLMKERTTIVIAHRLATVRSAHRIVVVDGGRVVEIGSHRELLEKPGLYARLHSIQFAAVSGARSS
ncbi:MAG: ABC transporter ATP-binding protein [Acidobacteriota bacterium]